jgi:hypothetical protein
MQVRSLLRYPRGVAVTLHLNLPGARSKRSCGMARYQKVHYHHTPTPFRIQILSILISHPRIGRTIREIQAIAIRLILFSTFNCVYSLEVFH